MLQSRVPGATDKAATSSAGRSSACSVRTGRKTDFFEVLSGLVRPTAGEFGPNGSTGVPRN
jgi:hypothetical protein